MAYATYMADKERLHTRDGVFGHVSAIRCLRSNNLILVKWTREFKNKVKSLRIRLVLARKKCASFSRRVMRNLSERTRE